MVTERTPDERRTDSALLLALWLRTAQKPREDAGDKLRQMKLAFLAAHAFNRERARGLNLSFYRWTWGPMSNEVYTAWDDLERTGFLESEEHFVITREGESLGRAFYEEVLRDERNAIFRSALDDVAGLWRDKPATAPLLDAVYEMQIVPVGKSERLAIREIRRGEELIAPLDPKGARATLFVERAWLETLAIEMKPAVRSMIRRAQADFREGRIEVA